MSQYSEKWITENGYQNLTDEEIDIRENVKRERKEEEQSWIWRNLFPEAFPKPIFETRADKHEVREKINVLHMLQTMGIKHRITGDTVMMLCPVHDDRTPSANFSIKKKLWHCHACNAGGDIFSFAMQVECLTFPQAVEYLNKIAY